MIKQSYPYHLARRGKWFCPECGRKTFVCYVSSDTGEVLNECVGKCDRADKCAYHYTPREYFSENPNESSFKKEWRPTYRIKPRPDYISADILKSSLKGYGNNNLITFLSSMFSDEEVNDMIEKYFIGTSKHWHGSTVFWQIDTDGKIHQGKIMLYSPDTGKRVKEPFNHITSVHSVLKLSGNKPNECLFGEHLIRQYDGIICIVESEKTAVVLNECLIDGIAVACGGCSKLTPQRCKPLVGKDIVLLPDNGKYKEWCAKADELKNMFNRVAVTDIMEKEAENQGDDIMDLLVSRIRQGTLSQFDLQGKVFKL